MSIRWDDLEPQKYEDMVSVLLSRLHPDSQRIDGKGGDGGRDVQIVGGTDGSIAEAFQLKSFTGRMTSSRRKQVARSLYRAAGLKPDRWTLIVPIDPTPAEESWFRQIGGGYRFPTRWFGKTWLDEKMSAFPDIRRYFMEGANDEVVRLLQELQAEKARVSDVPDAVARFRTLRESLNEIDPHYRYELSTGPTAADGRPADVALSVSFSDMRVDVYPKYSGAVKDRPISIEVKVLVGPEYDVVHDAMDYGLETTIPSHMISSVTVNAPFGLGGSFTGMEFHLFPNNTRLDEPVTLALNVMDGDKLLASWPVHLTERTGGPRGSIVTGADKTGWLQTRLKMDGVNKECEVKFWLTPSPAMPATLVPLFRWIGVLQPPNSLTIRWPGGAEMRCGIRTPFPLDEGIGMVVEALAYLQDRSGFYWEMRPCSIQEDGQEIMMAAALLKGETIDVKWKSVNLSLSGWGRDCKNW